MRFSKTDNIYKVIRITGSQDNILGVTFAEKHRTDHHIEIIEWDFPNLAKGKIRSLKERVLEQVLSGLKSVNAALGTNYQLSKIYFTPFDSSRNDVYSALISVLIRHYHNGEEFI